MIPFPPGSLVAAYLRDSGGDTQELSTAQQELAFRQFCAQSGLVVGKIFIDAARPGSSIVDRTAFHDMMHHFRTGAPETGLVIWSYSRFARDFDDAQFHRADLRRRGYIFHSLNDEIPSGSIGRLFEAAIDWKNEQFLEDLSRDVKRGLANLVANHGAIPGTPPRGFIRQPVEIGPHRDGQPHIVHRWDPDPEMIPRIRQAFDLRAAGKSVHEIHRTTHIYSSLNSYTTFFRNKIYIGVLEYGDQTIADYCEPIVPLSTWLAVQKIQSQTPANAAARHPRRQNSAYLLSGLIYCGQCGSPLMGHSSPQRSGSTYRRYACSRAHRRHDCNLKTIPAQTLESAILKTIREYILTADSLTIYQDRLQSTAGERQAEVIRRRKELTTRLAAVRRQIDNIATALAEAGSSRALLAKLTELETQESEILSQISTLETQKKQPIPNLDQDQLKNLTDQLRQQLAADPATTQRLLRGLIVKIIVDRIDNQVLGEVTYRFPPMIK